MNRVTVAIDSLILDGTDGLDPQVLASALERRLVELVSSQGFRRQELLEPRRSMPTILLHEPSARAIGTALAETILGGRR